MQMAKDYIDVIGKSVQYAFYKKRQGVTFMDKPEVYT